MRTLFFGFVILLATLFDSAQAQRADSVKLTVKLTPKHNYANSLFIVDTSMKFAPVYNYYYYGEWSLEGGDKVVVSIQAISGHTHPIDKRSGGMGRPVFFAEEGVNAYYYSVANDIYIELDSDKGDFFAHRFFPDIDQTIKDEEEVNTVRRLYSSRVKESWRVDENKNLIIFRDYIFTPFPEEGWGRRYMLQCRWNKNRFELFDIQSKEWRYPKSYR